MVGFMGEGRLGFTLLEDLGRRDNSYLVFYTSEVILSVLVVGSIVALLQYAYMKRDEKRPCLIRRRAKGAVWVFTICAALPLRNFGNASFPPITALVAVTGLTSWLLSWLKLEFKIVDIGFLDWLLVAVMQYLICDALYDAHKLGIVLLCGGLGVLFRVYFYCYTIPDDVIHVEVKEDIEMPPV